MSLGGPIAVVVGTRPEAIKLAPVVTELRRRGEQTLLVSTGQHREMLAQSLAVFGLVPDAELAVMTPGQGLAELTARTVEGMTSVLVAPRPRWVVVQGDTTTAFAAALAASYAKIPVAHVEAGLRSGARYSPFPEEMNRRLIDQLSEKLFAPTPQARALLTREGFAPASIEVTGNTVVDALLAARERVRVEPVAIPSLGAALAGRRMVLVTAHRRESFGDGLASICHALRAIVEADPTVVVVYPVHLNPNVDGPVRRILAGAPRVVLLPPVSYLQFVHLLDRAHLVLTDSGGVQEEAPTFRKPLLVMRDVTERPEGIAAGVARLVGTRTETIFAATMRLLGDPELYAVMASGSNPYGDGFASRRIVDSLVGTPAEAQSPVAA
ncbi:MAG TPA: UDP-N-acetylglucosamine 2-epimerase (non-hydrolyzing) [Anaeromyxobacter sp.]